MKVCNLNVKNNLFKSTINKLKPRNVGIILIDKEKYILKIEDIDGKEETKTDEYIFYKKFKSKIKSDHFDLIIQLPIKYSICNNKIKYLFELLKGDIDTTFLLKISHKNIINILQQSLFSLYYINHYLHYYHNDLCTSRKMYKLNNLMYIKNDKEKKLEIDGLKLIIKKYRVLIIDFGLSSKIMGYKGTILYDGLKIFFLYDFKYKSELFILFIIFLHTYKGIDFLKIKDYYISFEKKMKKNSLIEFDKSLYNNFQDFL